MIKYTQTNNVEVNTYIAERIELLPQELREVIKNEEFFNSIPSLLSTLRLTSETLELITYEIFLILIRITALDDLVETLITEHDVEFKEAISISNILKEQLLPNYINLLTLKSEEIPKTQNNTNPLSALPNVQEEQTPQWGSATQEEVTTPDLEIPRYKKPLTNIPNYTDS